MHSQQHFWGAQLCMEVHLFLSGKVHATASLLMVCPTFLAVSAELATVQKYVCLLWENRFNSIPTLNSSTFSLPDVLPRCLNHASCTWC